MKGTIITKANGEEEIFELQKLLRSLLRSGATHVMAKEVVSKIEASLYAGISTKEIYKNAFSMLRKKSRPTAARYKLKKAILELGESGYPFEKFVGELLQAEGFNVEVGVIVPGHCVTHEVDVIAQKDNHHYMCECKFHNSKQRNCDVKIPLYIQSRFKDVEAQWEKKKGHIDMFHQAWIFTNTRFSSDAIQYGACMGMQLISWDYPKGRGIKDRIDSTGVHPITSLTTLSTREKQELIKLEIISCRQLCLSPQSLNKIHIKETRHKKIMDEATAVCQLIKSTDKR